ncbi:MAG: metallophosphoesterase [Acidimicrobiia bacterium]|jgi:calcineurin-like phosphoesterase family protein|nr:metallophosphoesterase [Acidimicrobiia bacterium]MBA3982011.1 metallophosphoesterase [Acidimicrobiia bacterium]MDQ3391791.1 metallophosphoesterase [Actinomycetota bacterium]
MTRWFTADLHFGHTNIIRYCERPFADAQTMNAELISRWNDLVADDDEVWVLGDVAMGTIAETLPLVGELSGRKVLVPGNHDRCWAGHGPQAAEWVGRYHDAGFDAILQGVVPLEVGGSPARACHFPIEGDSHDEDRFDSFRPEPAPGWLLHGHVHTRWRRNGEQLNVGCDVWDYRPVAEGVVVETLQDRQRPAGSWP